MSILEIIFSVLGVVFTFSSGIIAFFASRTLNQIDTNMKKVMDDFDALKEKFIKSNELIEYLKSELAKVSKKCEVLQRAFTRIDKVLYAKNIKINHPEPEQDETV